MTQPIRFSLNGEPHSARCRADMTVLEWLRGEALLRGTKEGCAEGDCGACTVLLKRHDEDKYTPANSCIMLMGQVDGANLTTVEGLAACSDEGHVVQQLMAENGSSQCGFCTPGIVSALSGLLEKNSNPSESEVHDALAGNLCRCTGYRPIVEAAFAAAKQHKGCLPSGPADAPELSVGDDDSICAAPASLKALLDMMCKQPDAQLLAGGTDISLAVAHARERWPQIIQTRNVAELRELKVNKTHLEIGGAVTWQEVLPHLQNYWPSFASMVRRFGSTQIRAMGTPAGNLATASPIGDGAPSFLALGASLVLAKSGGEREIPLDEFFVGYRKSALEAGEIIKTIKLPLPNKGDQFRVYKISKRYDQDISTVCGAFNVSLENGKVIEAKVAFGGMAAVPLRSLEAEKSLEGQPLTQDSISAAKRAVRNALKPMDDMRGTARYRLRVAENLIERVALDLNGETVEVMAL